MLFPAINIFYQMAGVLTFSRTKTAVAILQPLWLRHAPRCGKFIDYGVRFFLKYLMALTADDREFVQKVSLKGILCKLKVMIGNR